MSKPMQASIIVSSYNYGSYLREAIDSALGQTYPHVEAIVVDDGSIDNSREIITTYGSRIIPVLKLNGGQASALNVRISTIAVVRVVSLETTLRSSSVRVEGVAPGLVERKRCDKRIR